MYYLLQNWQGFNGADLRNVCTEAGMSAIRAERDYVIHEDFMKVSSCFILEAIFPLYEFLYEGSTLLYLFTLLPGRKEIE